MCDQHHSERTPIPRLTPSRIVIFVFLPTISSLSAFRFPTFIQCSPVISEYVMEPRRRVIRACEPCKVRKVKCNGQQRCQQCSHLGLRCIYPTPAAKPRSQGKRGHLISELKSQSYEAQSSNAPLLPASGADAQRHQFDASFFIDLLPSYLKSVFPVHPIIKESEIRESIGSMRFDHEERAFVFAFGGCTLNLTKVGSQRTPNVTETIAALYKQSMEALGLYQIEFRATVKKAMTFIFLHNCVMSMRESDTAFFLMRNAITTIELLRVESSQTQLTLTTPERARRQRLYWEAFVHERFLAILDYRSAVLQPLKNLPEDDPSIPLSVQEGFNEIIKLFKLLDQDFLQNWNESRGSITPAWIEKKSKELDEEQSKSDSNMFALTAMQRADLVVTRQWLKTLIWRLAMSNTLLSSQPSKECLSLLFPVRLSRQLHQQITNLSREDIEVHGSGIVQKLFEITDTIADVITHVPAATLEETSLRVSDFLFLLEFLFQFPTLDATRRAILSGKLHALQEMFHPVVSSPKATSETVGSRQLADDSDPWYRMSRLIIPHVLGPTSEITSPNPAEDQTIMDQDWDNGRKTHHNEIAHQLSSVHYGP
jgi:hypothetical protein